MNSHELTSDNEEQASAVKEAAVNLLISDRVLHNYLYGKREVKAVSSTDRKRKRSGEHENDYNRKIKTIWCEECYKYIEEYCPIHNPQQKCTYAVKSFPAEVRLCISSIPGYEYGACGGQRIPRGTWIGPYEGRLVDSKTIDYLADNTYIWEIYNKNGEFSHFLDGSDESCSSWMRFIRCARHKNEQNMAVFQFGENIYYRAINDITVGEEILVWYDQSYSQFLGIPFAMNQDIKKGTKGTNVDPPFAAQHSSLPNTSGRQQMVTATSPSTLQSPRFAPPHRSLPHTAPHSTKPTYTHNLQHQPPNQTPPIFRQQSPLHSPSSTVSSPIPPPQPSPLQSPSSTVPSAYEVPPQSQVPPFSMNPVFKQTGPPQGYQNTYYGSPNISAGKPTNAVVGGNDSSMIQATPPTLTHYKWNVAEVKENVPVKNFHASTDDFQSKIPNNTQPMKSSPLQSLSPSMNSTTPATPLPESKTEQNIVSSTVETKEEVGNSWKCGQCKKTFSQRLILQIHVCTGAPKKPYQCGRCPLSFSDPSKLRDHVVTHNNDRPFKCGFCGRSFAGATTLNNHMRMHTGERPFSCEKCGNSFVTATQLSRHSKQPSECRVKVTETMWNNNNQPIAVE